MVKTKQKFLFRCSRCGATFFFYIDIDNEDDKTTKDKKLWCMSCSKRGTLVRVELVKEKKFEYNPDDYR